jgi:aromatic-L-amino-acid decarboxylase
VPPDLSIVAFHVQRDDPAGALTAELLRRVNAERRVLLSSTRIGGRYVGRICILNHRTDRDRVDVAVRSVRRHASELVHGEARAA